KRHHSMLHADSDSETDQLAPPANEPSPTSPSPTVAVNSLLAASTSRPRSQVLLATARVRVEGDSGRCVVARALIDQGSEATFISEGLAQTLRTRRIRRPVSISAVGGAQVGTVRHAAQITVSPVATANPSFSTTALILPSLTSYAPRRVSTMSAFSHLSDLPWADPHPTCSDPIQVIIGADLYSDLILSGIRKGNSGQPIAQNSVFGWIISGPLPAVAEHVPSHTSVQLCTFDVSLSEDLQRFWEIEELPPSQILSPQDEQCENHFRETHSRDDRGRYVVRLPFKAPPPIDIGRSKQSADRMLQSLLHRFKSQPELESDYRDFMREYERLEHMRPISETPCSRSQAVYIPHHP
ncbi:PREDICTED: uncharacterized protein LOC105565880, partial [Vollenhovia emeryi]|uniref:uncharacterized protein LOC105565880 n=1 Tax=Vollenhovia emeryi TaxID=411798 RepID=UPI0005F41073